jgi:hypothetical protein
MRIAAALGVSPSNLVPALGAVIRPEDAPNLRRGSLLPVWIRWHCSPQTRDCVS